MARRWYYLRDGQTCGPYTGKQIKKRAASGALRPENPLWPEESDQRQAVAAGDALDFSALRPPSTDEILTVESAAASPEDELRGWLADLDDLFRNTEQTTRQTEEATPSWLPPPAAPAVGPSPKAASAVTRHSTPPADLTAVALLERMGVDPVSGRLVDAKKLEAWLREQRRQMPNELPFPPESDPDPTHTARKQLAAWLDSDKNRARLAKGDVAAIRNDPSLKVFMNHFSRYGSSKQEGLWKYLEFLIERRK